MTTSKFRLLFAALSFITISACGKSSPSDSFSANFSVPNHPFIPTRDEQKADDLIKKAEVQCAVDSDKDCPAGIGMLVSKLKSENGEIIGVGMCTVFRINRTTLMTNSHCIPNDIKFQAGVTKCENQGMVFLFPKHGDRPAQRIGCKVVEGFSVIPESPDSMKLNPDYAIIQVAPDPSNSEPGFPLSYEGVADRKELTNFRMTPVSSDQAFGMIHPVRCRSVQGSLINPGYRDEFAPIVSFQCEGKHGNSGSPLVDENGAVRAILHAGADTEKMRSSLSSISLPPRLEPMIHATNLACVRPIEEGRKIPQSCNRNMEANYRQDLTSLISAENLAPEMDKVFTDYFKRLDPVLGPSDPFLLEFNSYSQSPVGAIADLIAVPKCFRDPKTWVDQYKGFLGFSLTKKLNYPLPHALLKMGLNSVLQIRFTLEEKKSVMSQIRFSPRAVQRHQSSSVQMKLPKAADSQTKLKKRLELSVCPAS